MRPSSRRLSIGLGLVAASLVAGARAAEAHIQLDVPTPHFVFDNDQIETAPCGSGKVSGAVNPPLTGGDTLTVMWHETINHDGHYRIGLSANQADFTVPTSLDIPAPPLPAWDLLDGIPDTSTDDGTFSATITIPNMNCPHCVLQLVQIASLSSDGSNTGGYYTNYYGCADLDITARANGSGGAPGGGGNGASGSSGGSGSGGHGGTTGGAGGSSDTGGVTASGTGGGGQAGTAQQTGGKGGSGGGPAGGGTGGVTSTGGQVTDPGSSSSGCSLATGASSGGASASVLLLGGLVALLRRRARRRPPAVR
jgi:hypothetical protein